MSTGYTGDQIRQFDILITQNRPPAQDAAQLDGAPVVADADVTGSGKGALIRMGFAHDAVHHFFLNCAVARALVLGLEDAARDEAWPAGKSRVAVDDRMPTDDEIWAAFKVLSLRIDSTPEGVLVSFATGRTVSQFFVPNQQVQDVLAGVCRLAERHRWWDDKRQMIPLEASEI